MDTLEKSYSCKLCGMAFPCGRVLGGHVRRHLAAERSASRDKKLQIVAEKSGIHGDEIDGEYEHGGHFLRANPKKSAKSLGLDDREIDSSSGNCHRYRKGFRIGLHTSMGGRRGEGGDEDMPSLDRGTKAGDTSKKSLLEEILRDYERVYPTIRKKRSKRARYNRDLSGKDVISDVDMPSSLLLSSGIHKDEMDAAISLLTISAGIMNWESSAVRNEFLKESSSMDEIENVEGVSDGFNLGVSNKRRVCEFDGVGLKLPKLPGCIGSFSTFANVGEKSVEHEVSLHVTSGGVEVRSSRKGDVVEEMKTMVVDVLKGERLPNLISEDEVGGDGRQMKLSDPDYRKTELVFKRTGYKCKNCQKIFPTHQALGCHRVEYRNRTSCCSSLTSEKRKNVTVNGDVSSPSPSDEANETLSPYKAGLEEQNHSVAARDKVHTLGHALNDQERSPYDKGSASGVSKRSPYDKGSASGVSKRSPYDKGSASGVSKRSCYGTVPLEVNAPMGMFGDDRNLKVF